MSIASAPPALSIRAAAAMLRVTERRVLALIACGELAPVLEPGRSLKVDHASVTEYLRHRTQD